MGRIQLLLFSNNENIRIKNKTINCLQLERLQLIEWLLYKDSVKNLLLTWSNNIHQMVLDSVSLKKNTYWLMTWTTNLESRLNNYKCASDWFNNFQLLVLKNLKTIYKLTKSDKLTLAHEEFAKIKLCLNVLSSEQVEYICDTCSKTTTVIPEYIPKKGSSSLRENVKAMNIDLKNDTKKDANPKTKLVIFKKEMLPENLDLALGQLKIWAQNNGAKSAFEKAFTLSDLKILIQAFQNKPVKVKEKKKSALIDLLFNHLNNGSEFNEETKKKGQLFT
ncbi:7289_t:CDS:2 [Gigaspora margarita]|uniref:7289_t:CDS:1 n=1 Tax=Gigaspora margarita TaxID=4874 RepID=A0ABN7UPF7_GIGMA|nr:7289_t:CDS:2 [Gigaspora margarita]